MRTAILVTVLGFALAACGESTNTPNAKETPRATEANPTAPVVRCPAVGVEELTQIQILAKPGVPVELERGARFTSPKHPDLTFVAAMITGDAVNEGAVGVWSTVDLLPLPPGGSIFQSVDEDAQRFTSWPKASDSAMRINSGDPVVEEAERCLAD